mmetsp:Transcript_121734/g.344321  ORF Transcript_121734/g.344321 Transcript_121734/m.344321 type:complete len:230 (+) Transcript_121734:829-1518(+)
MHAAHDVLRADDGHAAEAEHLRRGVGLHVGRGFVRDRRGHCSEWRVDGLREFHVLLRCGNEHPLALLRRPRLRFQGRSRVERQAQRLGHDMLHGASRSVLHVPYRLLRLEAGLGHLGVAVRSAHDGLGGLRQALAGQPRDLRLGRALGVLGVCLQHFRDVPDREAQPRDDSFCRKLQQSGHHSLLAAAPRGDPGDRLPRSRGPCSSSREHRGLLLLQRAEVEAAKQKMI